MNPPGARASTQRALLSRHCCIRYAKVQAERARRAEMPHTVAVDRVKKIEFHATKKWPQASGPLAESLMRGTYRPKPNISGTSDCSQAFTGRDAEGRRCEWQSAHSPSKHGR